MNKQNLLVSSCLLGENVKYNGKNNYIKEIEDLKERYNIFSFCPEVSGGLPIPRVPCEIISLSPLKIINKLNEDKTINFIDGAKNTLQLCVENNIKLCLLKANSPSCSNHLIYDGTFSSTKINGLGVTAQLLKINNIKVYNENEINILFAI